MTDPNDKKTEQTNRDGSTGFQTTVHGGTVNISHHYHSAASPKPGGIDFERYIQFIRQDSRYQNVRDLYTETEALIPLEAETVERKSERSEQDTEQAQKKVERFPVLEGVRKYALGHERQHVLLAGRTGSGKSTTLKRLLLELADEWLADSTQPVPIYIQLKRDSSPLELITDELEKGDIELEEKEIKRLLRRKRLILLLDGINEIPSEQRRRKLQEFREDHPTTPMIFTTRDLSVGGDLGIKKRLEMLLLSDPQMRQFVGKYLSDRGMSDQTDTLLRQLHDRLQEIAETPLLLEMLCDVFDPVTRQIPRSKGELFRQFDRDYKHIKKDSQPVSVSKNFWEFKTDILQFLAFSMIQTDDSKSVEAYYTVPNGWAETLLEKWINDRGVFDSPTKAKLWLKDLRRCHLLQDAKNPGDIEFCHQLFQEYYAAEYLLRLLPDLSDEQLKRDYLNLLKWTESVALMLALVNEEKQALRVVKLAMNDVDLLLGAKLAGEVHKNSRLRLLQTIFSSKRFHNLSQHLRLRILGATRLSEAVPLIQEHLTSKDEGIVHSARIALNLINPRVSSNTQSEDSRFDDIEFFSESQLLEARKNVDSRIRAMVANSLGKFKTQSALEALLGLLQDSEAWVRGNAAAALAELDRKKSVSSLINALVNDAHETVRGNSAYSLGIIGSVFSEEALITALDDSHHFVQNHAADALGRIASPTAKTVLLARIGDQNPQIRGQSAYALRFIDLPETRAALVNILKDESAYVREKALCALDKLSYSDEEVLLRIFLDDQSIRVQEAAAVILTQIKSPRVEDKMIKSLKYRRSKTRILAAYVLGEMGTSNAVKALIAALDNTALNVQYAVSKAISKTAQGNVLPILVKRAETDQKLIFLSTIDTIQNRCKFYNYEIWQEAIRYAKSERQKKEQATEQRQNVFSNATEVKVFERVEHYYENSLSMKEPPS